MPQRELLDACSEHVRSIRIVSTLLVQVLFRGDSDCLAPADCNALGRLFDSELDWLEAGLGDLRKESESTSSKGLITRAAELKGILEKTRALSASPSHSVSKAYDELETNIAEVFELAGLDRGLGCRALDEAARLRPAAYPTARNLRQNETTDLNAFLEEFGDKVAPANRRCG